MATVRIAGVTLPPKKRVEVALTYLYGVGLTRSKYVLSQTKVNPDTRVEALTEKEANVIRELIEKTYKVEGDLKRQILMNIKRLKEVGAYRGIRHSRNLPVRGQRTKTNSRTVRGNVRKTMGSGRKAAAEKT